MALTCRSVVDCSHPAMTGPDGLKALDLGVFVVQGRLVDHRLPACSARAVGHHDQPIDVGAEARAADEDAAVGRALESSRLGHAVFARRPRVAKDERAVRVELGDQESPGRVASQAARADHVAAGVESDLREGPVPTLRAHAPAPQQAATGGVGAHHGGVVGRPGSRAEVDGPGPSGDQVATPDGGGQGGPPLRSTRGVRDEQPMGTNGSAGVYVVVAPDRYRHEPVEMT
jgi:hypothetical protein